MCSRKAIHSSRVSLQARRTPVSNVAAHRAALAGEGRATLRRLNRHEYENALRDLLGVPWAQVADRLPEDGEAHRFNKSGEALDVSYLTMERFVESADYALRLAMASVTIWRSCPACGWSPAARPAVIMFSTAGPKPMRV